MDSRVNNKIIDIKKLSKLINKLFFADIIEDSSTPQSRTVVRTLFHVLDDFPWGMMDADLMDRILEMYYYSVRDEDENDSIRKGLEKCIRNILKNLESADLIIVVIKANVMLSKLTRGSITSLLFIS